MSLFVTRSVESIEREAACWTAIGWAVDADPSDHNVLCVAVAVAPYVTRRTREMYASVGGAE